MFQPFSIKCPSLAYAISLKKMTPFVEFVAPFRVDVVENTTCFADEIIINRVGLIPVSHEVDEDDVVEIEAMKEGTFTFKNAFVKDKMHASSSTEDIVVAILEKGQTLKMKAFLNKKNGFHHARYNMISRVNVEEKNGEFFMTFSIISSHSPEYVLTSLKQIAQKYLH